MGNFARLHHPEGWAKKIAEITGIALAFWRGLILKFTKS